MANIYLQLPYYVDCFYRCRAVEEKDRIPKGTPLEFSKYSEEYYILHHYLTLDNFLEQGHKSLCFSNHDWKTMLTGKSPVTGEKILIREKDEYLSVGEVSTLLGVKSGANAENSEYLCIRIPSNVFRDGTMHSTNASYTLSETGIKMLRQLMSQEFQRAITTYIKTMEHYVVKQGGMPQRIDLLNAFLSRYGIYKIAGHKERETLRRMLNRWLGDERYIMEAERLAGDMLPYIDNPKQVVQKEMKQEDFDLIKEKYNAARRLRYHTDEAYRKREQERAKQYKKNRKEADI